MKKKVIIIVCGVAILLLIILRILISRPKEDKELGEVGEPVGQESVYEEESASLEPEIEKEEEEVSPQESIYEEAKEDDPVITLSNINSVLKYEVDPEIEKLIEPERFDKELTEYLKNKGKIVDSSHESNSEGLFLVKSTPYITISLDDDMYLFDLQIDDGNRSIVTVSVTQGGIYGFSLY